MSAQERTRFAPTPSGFLHRGNAVNALLCAWVSDDVGGELILRIDDLDRERWRPEYEADILDLVDWLDLRVADIVRQSDRMPAYMAARDALMATPGAAFACRCSRREIAAGDPCSCAGDEIPLETGATALKARIDGADVVLWRRDGVPAYHLASVVDDDALGMSQIVRGDDLREATGIQRALAVVLGAERFAKARVRFHGLLTDDAGAKLSKSQLSSAGSGPLPRTAAMRDALHAAAITLARASGLPHP